MAKGNGLGVTLPEQAETDDNSFDISSRPLAAWIRALPVANIGETTKQLYRALHDVNRHRHRWKRRYQFLEAIRQPLDSVQRAFGQRYSTLTFPLPAKSQQIVTLAQRLHLEMALGYMAAVEGMLNSHVLFHDRHALKVMVHRACRHLNQSVLIAYQVYGQQRSGIWQQLHRLYTFAESRGFHQYSIKDPLFDELPKSSIARVYKQIVLLAAASPYRMRQGEAVAVHRALARWAAHAELLESDDTDAAKALFVLHLDSDEEPEYRSHDHRPCDKPACRLIDTSRLVHLVQEEAGQTSPTAPASLLTPELYRRLLHDWAIAPSRGERRNEGGDNIDAVIGMIHIHQLFARAQHVTTPPPTPSRFASDPSRDKTSPATPPRSSDDLWNPFTAQPNKGAAKPSPQPQAAPATLPILCWRIINESVGGFRLAVPAGQEAAVRVGEVVALRELHSPDRWHLTVVRWIHQFDEGLFEAGVQIIASDPLTAMVKSATPGKDKGEFQRGLLLPEAPERHQPATLFVPNRLFRPAEKVLLHVSGHQMEIVLGNAIQESGSFVQFELNTGEKMDTPSAQKAAGAGGSPFEMLWGQL